MPTTSGSDTTNGGVDSSIIKKSKFGGIKILSRMTSFEKSEEDEAENVKMIRFTSQDPTKGDDDAEAAKNERQKWDRPLEFLMSCISSSVGLGNVWRLPHTAYENGGGAFLIPYLIVLMLVGRPLYFMEVGLGQFSGAGCESLWNMVPGFAGVSLTQSLTLACTLSYYCVIIALSIYYLVMSFYPTLPWTLCTELLLQNSSSLLCIPSGDDIKQYITCHPPEDGRKDTLCLLKDDLPSSDMANVTTISSTELFWKTVVKDPGINFGLNETTYAATHGLGLPDPTLAACLAVCWLIIYCVLRNGVKSSGKVAYFTAIFPYVVLFTLLVRGLTLEGAMDGLALLFKPNWGKLLEGKVWYEATVQALLSLSIGYGTLVSYSSFNNFRHNASRDVLVLSLMDTFTSVLAGVVTFSILGHLAHTNGKKVEDVVSSGMGLAFVTYPEVVASFTFAPQLFSALFFLMMITLGIGSATGLLTALMGALYDAFPKVEKKFLLKLACIALFLFGLVYVTPCGMMVLEIVDHYGNTLLLLAIAAMEVIAVSWIYGTNKLARDFNFMLNTNLSVYWRLCWSFLCPIILSALFVFNLSQDNLFQGKGVSVGWVFTVTGLLFVPFRMVVAVFGDTDTESGSLVSKVIASVRQGTIVEKIVRAFQPNASWGPASKEERTAWELHCKDEPVGFHQWVPKMIRKRFTNQQPASLSNA